ncbi:MAG: LPS assembly lipoprotein LptE [Isosphaeraceae bacterium]|nr:LPS assembly lipoprotein LptE [Isosphaeraceae bacterium]
MRTDRRLGAPTAVLALAALLALVPGCGYSIRAPYDKSVRTVYVPIFRCQTFRRDINYQLTDLLMKEIERRTPYKVVSSPEGADTILQGVIQSSDKNTIVENPDNLPRQLTSSLTVSVTWTRNPPTEDEKKRGPTVVTEVSNFAPEIGETTETAFYRTCQNIATQIVDMMEAPWQRNIKGD